MSRGKKTVRKKNRIYEAAIKQPGEHYKKIPRKYGACDESKVVEELRREFGDQQDYKVRLIINKER